MVVGIIAIVLFCASLLLFRTLLFMGVRKRIIVIAFILFQLFQVIIIYGTYSWIYSKSVVTVQKIMPLYGDVWILLDPGLGKWYYLIDYGDSVVSVSIPSTIPTQIKRGTPAELELTTQVNYKGPNSKSMPTNAIFTLPNGRAGIQISEFNTDIQEGKILSKGDGWAE